MPSGDPYTVLSVTRDSDDAAIRARYLELVREYPPEQYPAKFAAIRAAYDALKDLDSRVRARLFPDPPLDAIESILEDLACRTPRPRITLETLLHVVLPAR